MFNNCTGEAPAKASFEINKKITTADDETVTPTYQDMIDKGVAFEFVLYSGADAIDSATCDADGKVSFGEYEYDTAGTYYYSIVENPIYTSSEKTTVDPCWTDVTKTIYIKVDVTDNNGTLTATTGYYSDSECTQALEKAEYENQYRENPAEMVLKVKKNIVAGDEESTPPTYQDMIDNETPFEFTLKTIEGKELLTASCDANGKVEFGKITYKKEGTYRYVINEKTIYTDKEKSEADSRWEDITKNIYVKVVVNKEGSDLVATESYYSDAECTQELTDVTYTNEFTDVKPLNIKITGVNKEVKVNEGEFTPKIPTYWFGLYTDKSCKEESEVQRVQNDESKIEFSMTIDYDELKDVDRKEFTYYMKEIKGEDTGVKYSDQVVTVKFVIVKEDDHLIQEGNTTYDGKLVSTITNELDNPAPTTATLEVQKMFNGVMKDGDFSFTVTAKSASGVTEAEDPKDNYIESGMEGATKNMPMPAETTVTTKDVQQKEGYQSAVAEFGEIMYDRAGVYTYEITENAGTDANIEYSNETVTATVTVTANAENKLEAEVSYTGNEGLRDNVFTNTNTKTSDCSESITLYKKLCDRVTEQQITYNAGDSVHIFDSNDYKADMYLESVTDARGTAVTVANADALLQSVVNDTTGKMAFDAMTWTEGSENSYDADTRTFTISNAASYPLNYTFVFNEDWSEKGSNPSITCDKENKIRVTVTVTKDELTDGGEYAFTLTATKGDAVKDHTVLTTPESGDTFVNFYTAPTSTKFNLSGTKILKDGDKKVKLKDGQFSFHLVPVDNAPGAEETVKNLADGSFTFSDIEVTADMFKDGENTVTYQYLIQEVKGNYSNITYDTGKVIATVTLKKTGEAGNSSITVDSITYTKSDKKAEQISFTNKISKTVKTGDNAPLFIFPVIMIAALGAIVAVIKKRRG